MRSLRDSLWALGLLALRRAYGQSVQCATVPDGCDAGGTHEGGIRFAINRFEDGKLYGGSDPVVLSSATSGSTLAMVVYSCQDGTLPPLLEGSAIRARYVVSVLLLLVWANATVIRMESILSCPNRCGGVASSLSNSNCGFGIQLANNAVGTACFAKAIDVAPVGLYPGVVPAVGDYKYPRCLFDSPGQRVLVNGSSDQDGPNGMTVEKCVALADAEGWRYAGVEFGRYGPQVVGVSVIL